MLCLRYSFTLVLPTLVGMVRMLTRTSNDRHSSPHARGDGPYETRELALHAGFSPRPWGWSAKNKQPAQSQGVLPTPVGMVRF